MRDNNDIRPFFWFYDKDDKIMNANLYGSDFKVLPKDVYSIQFGIEHFNNGTTYDEDMYIELEISDKRPTQFQKYEVTDLSIALENGFNGALKDYYNEIKLIDGKWYLVNKFAHYVLDGTSSGNKVTAKQSKNNIDKYYLFLFVAQEEQPLPESGAPFCALASKKFAICRNLPALCLVPFSKMKAHLMPDLSPMRRIRYALVRKTKFPVEGNKRLLAGEDNASPFACARFGNHF